VAFEQHLGSAPCPDVAVTASEVVVVAGSGSVDRWVFSRDGGLQSKVTRAPGWMPKTDGVTTFYQDSSKFVAWAFGQPDVVVPGVPVGNNCTGVSSSGLWFVQTAEGVWCAGVRVADYRPTGIWECHNDGTVVMMDDAMRPAWAPEAGGYAHRCGPVTVAEGATGGTLVYLNGQRYRLWGETDAKWPRVSVLGEWVGIVSGGDAGTRLWVGSLADVAALPLDAAPPVVVTVPPAPAHLTMCGYFFRDTAIHAYVAPYGGENPEAPGTHSIIVDDHGMPAETRQDGTTPRMIVGLAQLLHPQLPGWWDRVDAVYVAVENDEDGLRSLMDLARYVMAFRQLAPKPILTYSGTAVFPSVHRPTDILGIQLYAERGTDPVRNLREQAAWYRAQTAHVPRVAILGQAFDRLGWFTGPQLAAIQPELYAIACAWPNCEGLFWFSDSRQGGTRDHEEMRPWHVAIADAISKR
jgi:hypothetical protein